MSQFQVPTSLSTMYQTHTLHIKRYCREAVDENCQTCAFHARTHWLSGLLWERLSVD